MEQCLYNISVKTMTKFVMKGELTVINPEVSESIPDCGTGFGYFGIYMIGTTYPIFVLSGSKGR